MNPNRQRLWTELGLCLMAVIWGVNFAVVKGALELIEPLGFNALRHVIASLLILVVLWMGGKIGWPERRDFGRIVLVSIVGVVVYQIAFVHGVERTRAGNASLMLALVPVFLLLFGWRGAENGVRSWLGAALSLSGVAVVSGGTLGLPGESTLAGDLILIGAAAIWGASTIGAKPLIERYGPIRTTAWTLWLGSVGLLLIGLPSLWRLEWREVGLEGWAGVFYSAFFAIGVAYLLWYRGVQHVGGARTAIFSNLTPVVALMVGALWLNETLTAQTLLGAAMVLGGVFLVPSTGTAGRVARA